MLIKLRKKSVQFVGQEERDANSNINCSMRALETEENVVTIGITVVCTGFADLIRRSACMQPLPLPLRGVIN
jgi:hypothetical protein